MLNTILHRQILLNILKDIYGDNKIAPCLGFKGGTCLYFFHHLDRFSTDLDFDLTSDSKRFDMLYLEKILEKYIKIEDSYEKHFTYFYLGSYEQSHKKVKVEISKRITTNEYEVNDLYGLAVKCMTKDYMFAHKLCAITERKSLANRDLYDIYFMFLNNFNIAENVIQEHFGINIKEYFQKLISYIPKHISKRGILDGLGEVLNLDRKKWVKEKLLKELLFYFKSYE